MLQRIHDGVKGWVAWLIIVAIIASLGLLGVNYYIKGQFSHNREIAAKVGQTTITQQEVTQAYNQFVQQLGQDQFGDEFKAQLKESFLKQLIDRALFSQLALENGFQATSQQVTDLLNQIPALQEKGVFSPERFNLWLNQVGYSPKAFFDRVESDLRVEQLQTGLINTEFVLPNEITRQVALDRQTREVSYAEIPFSSYLPEIKITPEQVKSFYEKNLSLFQEPEAFKFSYLSINNQDLAKNIHPTEAQLKALYQENIARYTQPAQWKIAEIVLYRDAKTPSAIEQTLKQVQQALQEKKSFESVAKEYSQDPLSARKGGELSWLATTALPPELQKILPELKPGQISSPIPTSEGYLLVKLLDQKAAVVTPFEQAKVKLQEEAIQQQVQQAFNAQVQQLQDLSFQNPGSLDQAANALHLKVLTTDWLTQNTAGTTLFSNPKISQVAFSQSFKNAGANSEVLYPDNNTAVVIRVQDYRAAKAASLEKVTPSIQMTLMTQAAQAKAQALATEVINSFKQGKSLLQLTAEKGVHWTTLKSLSRQPDPKQKLDPALVEAVFKTPLTMVQSPVMEMTVLPQKAIALIVVTGIVEGKMESLSSAEKMQYENRLKSEFSQAAAFELIRDYRQRTRIKQYSLQETQ